MKNETKTDEPKALKALKTALLVGTYRLSDEKSQCEDYLNELASLCDTYGLQVVQKIASPIRKIEAASFFRKRQTRRDQSAE